MRIVQVILLVLGLALASGGAAAQQKGWLGVEIKDLTKEEADALGWEGPRGAKVVTRVPASPAEAAGLTPDDIVLMLDGQEIESTKSFVDAIGARGPGAAVKLRVLRAGKERSLTVTLGLRPGDVAAPPVEEAKAQALHLMLDTGGHMALIRGVAFTPDGNFIVSTGDDKVIRVWDWRQGKTVRTIRGVAGAGEEGKIIALALSPDGKTLAAAGWFDKTTATVPCCGDIRIYDFATGELKGLLKGHIGVVGTLSFSPDGKRLVSGAGLGDLTAIIWDIASGRSLSTLTGHTAEIYGVAFTPDGARVVTASHDHTLRLWSVPDGKLITSLEGHKDLVWSVAVSRKDGTIASGSQDGELRLWDGKTGKHLKVLANQGTTVGALAFSPDGTRLLSTCGQRLPCLDHVWDVESGREIATHQIDDGIVIAAAVSPDGRLAATGGGDRREIHVWDMATGARVDGADGQPVRLGGTGTTGWAAGFSPDGRHIGWGVTFDYKNHSERGPIELMLSLPGKNESLGRPERTEGTPLSGQNWVRSATTFGPYSLSHRGGGHYGYDAILDIAKDKATIASIERGPTDGYQHLSYTFTPDGETIISGGSGGVLTAYLLQGQTVVGRYNGHEGEVWAVAPSADGKLLVSASFDQTVRLWNLKTRELIVTLFYGKDGEWVMWTPQGYYTGSPGTDKIVGWQINKGPDKAADYVRADQLRVHLNRPDIVERAIILASAEAAVKEARGTDFKLADLLDRPVPRVRLLGSSPGKSPGRADVKIAIDPTPDPVKSITIQVNGRQIKQLAPRVGTSGFEPGELPLDVPLGKGKNEIRIAAANAIGEQNLTLTLDQADEGALDKRGTLYIVSVGVDLYPKVPAMCGKSGKEPCNLRYSGADAAAFADAAQRRLGPSHAKVVAKVLVNSDLPDAQAPTANNIAEALDDLRLADVNDTVVVFIAGHGVNDGPDYLFLPTDAERTESGWRSTRTVRWYAIEEITRKAKGRRLLFLDTCHSGNAYNQKVGNASYHENIIAYLSADWNEQSVANSRLGHGLFTFALVEGLAGKAAGEQQRQISTKGLYDYIATRVSALAKELNVTQQPQYFKGRDADDYMLAQW